MNKAVAGRRAMKRALIEKCLKDEAFRERLLAEPKATVEQKLGQRLPTEIEVRVDEETPKTLHLVLPPIESDHDGGELSEEQLDQVAGGLDISGQAAGGGDIVDRSQDSRSQAGFRLF